MMKQVIRIELFPNEKLSSLLSVPCTEMMGHLWMDTVSSLVTVFLEAMELNFQIFSLASTYLCLHIAGGTLVKNHPLPMQEVQETWVQFLGWEDLLEEEMSTHSSILSWKIPWAEELGRLQSMGLQRVQHDWAHTHREGRNEHFYLQVIRLIIDESRHTQTYHICCGVFCTKV